MVSSSVNELGITHLEYLSKCFEGVPTMRWQIPSRQVPQIHKLYEEIGKLQSEMIHWDPCKSRMQENKEKGKKKRQYTKLLWGEL